MAAIQWGRKETIIFPPHNPIYSYGAVFLALVLTGFFVYLRFSFGQLPLQQYYTPIYVRAAAGGAVNKTDKYQLLYVGDGTKASRLATEDDVQEGTTLAPGGKEIPLTLSPAAKAQGYRFLIRGAPLQYKDALLHEYLKSAVYNRDEFWEIYKLPLLFGLLSLLMQLPFSVRKDIKRRKQMRYGRRLKGPERLTPKEFNRKVRGDGIGIKTDGLTELLRIPAKAEAQHVQIIADTGAGKTTLIMQILRQIRGRGDSAIVYDPALEYTRRFYDPRHDIILNPLDKRCPYWGPAEELRRSSEADAIAVSLFQPPQDKKGEFFVEIPQQIFAHLLRYGPTPQQLIEWMSHPKEIDDRVADTEVANFIDWSAAPQRVGVLASLSKVAKSLRLLPHKGEGNGEWTATEWSETRRGWIFITSLPAEREALRPLQSVWIDMLVLRLMNQPKADQKRVWFVLDELASLQRLPQLHTAITENRKSNNPVIMGFQGKAQLEVIYGHLAEVMLSQPATSIYLKTKEPNAGEWVSKAIGKVEIERMRETRFDGTRSGRNFALDRQIEPVVMESEISGLPDLHAFMKYENYVTGFSFPYLDMVGNEVAFQPRDLPDDKLTFEAKTLKPKGAAATVAPVVDLEAKPDGKTVAVAAQPDKTDLTPVGAAPVSPKDTAQDEDEQPIQPTLKF
jgi:type IV secretion system coupling TraD/TrwB family protein